MGREVARLLAPLVESVTLVSRDGPPPSATEWRDVVSKCGLLVLALPLTAETRALVGKDFFAELRPETMVVNVASGVLVDEANVLAFLARDRSNRYAADVAHPEPYPPDGALMTNKQVLLTPHVGARREDAWALIERRTLEVLDEALGAIAC